MDILPQKEKSVTIHTLFLPYLILILFRIQNQFELEIELGFVYDNDSDKKPQAEYDQELFAACMRRFLYICCYDSFEFLATLKVRGNIEI